MTEMTNTHRKEATAQHHGTKHSQHHATSHNLSKTPVDNKKRKKEEKEMLSTPLSCSVKEKKRRRKRVGSKGVRYDIAQKHTRERRSHNKSTEKEKKKKDAGAPFASPLTGVEVAGTKQTNKKKISIQVSAGRLQFCLTSSVLQSKRTTQANANVDSFADHDRCIQEEKKKHEKKEKHDATLHTRCQHHQ